MHKKSKGALYIILSSILYGITPIMVKYTYDGGSNGITASFLRGFFSVIFIIIIIAVNRSKYKLDKKYVLKALVAGFLGNGATTILLYMSYDYIPVGMTTTIHFLYPTITALACVILFKNKMNLATIISLLLGIAGVALFSGDSLYYDIRGIVLAILSGFAYSFYIIFISKSELSEMPDMLLALFVNIALTVEAFLYGFLSKELSLGLTAKAWIISAIVAFLASVVAQVFFQIGNRNIGSTSAAIISVLEPLTSVALGALILHEMINNWVIIGCCCILASIIIISISLNKNEKVE